MRQWLSRKIINIGWKIYPPNDREKLQLIMAYTAVRLSINMVLVVIDKRIKMTNMYIEILGQTNDPNIQRTIQEQKNLLMILESLRLEIEEIKNANSLQN